MKELNNINDVLDSYPHITVIRSDRGTPDITMLHFKDAPNDSNNLYSDAAQQHAEQAVQILRAHGFKCEVSDWDMHPLMTDGSCNNYYTIYIEGFYPSKLSIWTLAVKP